MVGDNLSKEEMPAESVMLCRIVFTKSFSLFRNETQAKAKLDAIEAKRLSENSAMAEAKTFTENHK